MLLEKLVLSVFIVLGVCIAGLLILGLFNRWLPAWACYKLGWHLPPHMQGFDGCSFNGVCPRCEKRVLQDSQGGWF